jgi:tetratricopeptide (TPR) repeat protein
MLFSAWSATTTRCGIRSWRCASTRPSATRSARPTHSTPPAGSTSSSASTGRDRALPAGPRAAGGRGDRYNQANTWDSIGLAHHELGELELATSSYRRAIAFYREVGDRWARRTRSTGSADTHRAAGRAAAARDAWRRAAETLDQIGDAGAAQIRAKLT